MPLKRKNEWITSGHVNFLSKTVLASRFSVFSMVPSMWKLKTVLASCFSVIFLMVPSFHAEVYFPQQFLDRCFDLSLTSTSTLIRTHLYIDKYGRFILKCNPCNQKSPGIEPTIFLFTSCPRPYWPSCFSEFQKWSKNTMHNETKPKKLHLKGN